MSETRGKSVDARSVQNVLVTDRFDREAFERLRLNLNATKAVTPSLSNEDLSSIDALLIRSRTKITRELLARAPRLRVIVTSTSGFDHVDLAACASAGVKVMYTPNANAASACELTWALALAAARKIPQANRMVSAGDWNREPLLGSQLSGKTYGVIGLGRIGSRVADVANAFGMRVIAHDPFKTNFGLASSVSLQEIFAESDVISVHVPSTPQTRHSITTALFAQARSGLIFINSSRGDVVRDEVLVHALAEGPLAACGLDVFETEPLPPSSPLIGHERVVLTPHIGATTHEAFKASSLEAVDKVLSFAQHGALSDELPGDAPWMRDARLMHT